jgi:predicted amidohydrolase
MPFWDKQGGKMGECLFDLVITNGICVTAADIAAYDVAIKNEKIVLLAASGSLAGASAKQVIDAQGGYVTVRSGSLLHATVATMS